MNYYFKDNKLIAYNQNVIEETTNDFVVEEPFCLDENGYKIFQALNKGKFKIENGVLKVGKSKIQLLNSTPPNFAKEFNSVFNVNLSKIKEASKFAAKSVERPVMTGVFVSENGCILATDSFKIYCYNENNLEIGNGIIITPEFVKELAKYNNTDCEMFFNNQVAQIRIDENTTITGRLITGVFPTVGSFLKLENKEPLNFDQDKFNNILKLGDLLKGDNRKIVFDSNTVSISNFESDGNEIVEELEANLVEPLCLSFENIKNIVSVLGDEYSAYIQSSTRPITFTNNAKDTICVIMPMRLY